MAKFLRAFVALLVVGAGVGVAGFLIANRPEAAQNRTEVPLTMVDVRTVEIEAIQVDVPAMGIVQAEREVTIQPEVGGVVVEQSDRLVEGGLVARGDALIKIDARDYATQLQITQAELVQAQLAVREESVQRKVAEAEWRDAPRISADSREYVLRQPHIEAAEARVESARSRIQKAKRDKGKTTLRAPFDGVVITEQVDVGQLVSPGSPIARVAGVARFWIVASIPVSQLQFVEIPGVNTDQAQGSTADVSAPGDAAHAREAYVLRLLPAVEERGRMAQVVVAVEDPMGLTKPPSERPTPLLVGTYVELKLHGRTLHDVVSVPRAALRDGDRVWVVDAQQRLESREVKVVWRERARVLVRGGLEAGDRLVLTNLPMATHGMRVEVADPASETAHATAETGGDDHDETAS
jgi:RND family efflux transporter MFP subunit